MLSYAQRGFPSRAVIKIYIRILNIMLPGCGGWESISKCKTGTCQKDKSSEFGNLEIFNIFGGGEIIITT